jgi:hypothetical protein
MALNIESLQVTTFQTSISEPVISDPRCCTGCTSGCGINPTAGGCDSKDDGTIIIAEPMVAVAEKPEAYAAY